MSALRGNVEQKVDESGVALKIIVQAKDSIGLMKNLLKNYSNQSK